jgi:hypothetical protein
MAAASAATQARHNAVGHVLLPASANDAPVKNPTIDPRTINAFIRFNRVLAERLPLCFAPSTHVDEPQCLQAILLRE